MPDEINVVGLVNKPPIDEIYNLDLINKPDLDSDDLYQSGILDMRWGVRRYQNKDGTLTELGKQRLREKRAKFEKKEAKKRIKEEKREAKAKARREKQIANPDPKWISKNMHKFSNEELYKAIERIKMKKNIEDIQKERINIGKQKADTLIGYGRTLNDMLKFINSDAGKGIREKLGFSTETIFDFYNQEKKKEKAQEDAKRWEDYKRKDAYDRAKNFEDWKKKDSWRREQEFEYDKKRAEAFPKENNQNYNNNYNSNNKDPWNYSSIGDYTFNKDRTSTEYQEDIDKYIQKNGIGGSYPGRKWDKRNKNKGHKNKGRKR